MTKLTDLMEQGYRVLISDAVPSGTMFVDGANDEGLLVVNRWDYPYLAYADPFQAHAINMERIREQIAVDAAAAVDRLNSMTEYLNRKNDPAVVVFLPNVEATDNGDGTYSFTAQPVGHDHDLFDDILHGRGKYAPDPVDALPPNKIGPRHARRK